MDKDKKINRRIISPSQFMRQLRPEYFSDTEKDQMAYVLDKAVFEHRLSIITNRNETQDFEIFCRKLCERTICSNLRSHTGPDGGGDSKVDTETYPVSGEIANNFYVGEANSSNERWAFAFSAKKRWGSKVKSDVKSIAKTKRDYKRIIFVTNQFAKDSTRSKIEDSLSEEYGIQVTIHDCSWIIQEVIDNNRKDLAFNYLGVGEINPDPYRLGPKDYLLSKQLEDIESNLNNPDTYKRMEIQRVKDSLLAAELSGNLEKPRNETDGRFLRAIRYAEADGSEFQKIEAKYGHIWASVYRFDDFEFLKDSYEDFEKVALQAGHVVALELLCNLLQFLFNGIYHSFLCPTECKFEEHFARLWKKLQSIAKDKNQPNRVAEAKLSLLHLQMIQFHINPNSEQLSNIWRSFSNLLKKVEGLGEFRVNRLEQMINAAGQIAGNDPGYNTLVEQAAEFFSKRESDVKAASVFLNRAEQIGFDENFEMIRFLGKASAKLAKKEHSELFIRAMQLLTPAYRSAGMLWAARASCIMLASALVVEFEEENQIPIQLVPVMKIWGWLALQLGNLPDFLFAIQMLNRFVNSLPLTDESKTKIKEDLQELDITLGCLFLNLEDKELKKLIFIPDVLDALGLHMARSALLYTLGHEKVLRAEGSIPREETKEEVNQLFSSLYSESIAEDLPHSINSNNGNTQSFQTILLGMQVEIRFDARQTSSIVHAQVIIATLEAFFSTTLEQQIRPHREKLFITLKIFKRSKQPSFDIDTTNMEGVIKWPESLSIKNFDNQNKIHKFLMEISYKVLVDAFIIDSPRDVMEELYVNEEVHQRMSIVASSFSAFSRVTTKEVLKLSCWKNFIQHEYDLKSKRPILQKIEFPTKEEAISRDNATNNFAFPKVTDHRAIKIYSVINVHAWNQANCVTVDYIYGSNWSPCMAFFFENEEGARKIFKDWHNRFGSEDKGDKIYISIIRHLPKWNKYHYCLHISSKLPDARDMSLGQTISMPHHAIVMDSNSDVELERFLQSYRDTGVYYLMPVILKNDRRETKFLYNFSILKRELTIKSASEITQHDIEFTLLEALNDS